MFRYTKNEIRKIAEQNHFIVNTMEKVLRLRDMLVYVNKTGVCKALALKGGTAINFCLLPLPRLSVDADFDFCADASKDETRTMRSMIADSIARFAKMEGYALSRNTRYSHSLDSFVYSYRTLSGSNDVLKIDINYSNRCHVSDPILSSVNVDPISGFTVITLAKDELIGTKVAALIERTTPRDVFDVYALLKHDAFVNAEFIKKIALFYMALSGERPFDVSKLRRNAIGRISSLDYGKLRSTLIPVLRLDCKLDIVEMKNAVVDYLNKMFVLSESELLFAENFNSNVFEQRLLFDQNEVNDLSNHPMVKWKLGR